MVLTTALLLSAAVSSAELETAFLNPPRSAKPHTWYHMMNGNATKEIGIKKIPQRVKDGKPSPTGRHTFTTWKYWDKDDELLPSGLIGPVRLLAVVESK